jgi:hypothetical protein
MRQIVPLTLAGLLVALSVPAVASATALVDDPAVADKLPARAKTYFAKREAAFQLWRQSKSGPETSSGRGSSPASRAWAAPYRILSTTSHKQRRNDYCVPATTSIIDHYLRGARRHWSQHRWASYKYAGVPLWTDARGGNMWVMAMGLRRTTGRAYSYSSGNTALSVRDRTEYAIYRKGRPVAYGVRVYASRWPNYRINHVGHIMCGRGFDWRYTGRIYVDDPYPENARPPLGYGSRGGNTYGKKTYSRDVVVNGVLASASRQVVY